MKIYKKEDLVTCKETGKSKKSKFYYLPEEDKWYYSPRFTKRIKELGYSKEYFYNKYFLGIDDPNYRPTCNNKDCLHKVKFNKTGIIEDGYNEYCCLSCARKHNWSTEEYRYNYKNSQKRIESNKTALKRFHSNEENHRKWLENRRKFNESGGAYGYMYRNPDKYPDFINLTKKNGGMMKILWERNPEFGVMNPDNKSIHLRNTNKGYKRGVFLSKKSDRIHYRSSYELRLMEILESWDLVTRFTSEPIKLYYKKPSDNFKIHRYYPDILIEMSTGVSVLAEVKPNSFINNIDVIAKYKAMNEYCRENNIVHLIITEDILFLSNELFFNKFLELI